MIILHDVPFERRAKFLHDSISAFPDSPEFAQALGEHAIDVAFGLQAHHGLLRRIYTDVACVGGKDDKARYLELVATMAFLYAVFALGSLVSEGDQYSVRIDKAVLAQAYKKGRLARRKRHLEYHGFSIKYLAAQGECAALSKASQLSMSYAPHPNLVPAVKLFAESTESVQDGGKTVMYNRLAIFLKGEYEVAILRKLILRDSLDPLRDDLLDTVDAYRKECQGSNLTKIDGVWLCKGRAEARRIYTYLRSARDFESIYAMLDIIC